MNGQPDILPPKLNSPYLKNCISKPNKFKNDSDRTCEMVGIQNSFNEPDTAAMVVVSNAMLNLDEVITK